MRVLKLSAIVLVLACGLERAAVAGQSAGAAPSGQVGGVVTTQGGPPPTQRPPQGRTPATQGPQRPTRDPRLPPTEGTGTISGRVVDATTGQALARVRVRFTGRDGGRSALTDGEGAFTLTRLPRGGVNIMVEKVGYLATSYPERRQSLRNSGMLMLADGQKIENVTVAMTRSSAIVGRLIDQFGEPVENVMVQAVAVPGAGRRTATPFRPMFRGGQGSNDIGEFRIARLDPGTYYLLAMPQRRQDEEGTAIGRTYYPGVASVDQAQPITVEKGQTVTGVEFTMLETTLVKVMGTVVNSSGEPVARGSITARMPPPPGQNTPGVFMMGMPDGSTGIRENGSFELRLQPGDYTIDAMPMNASGPGQFQSTSERGQIKLSVGAEPVMNVMIQTGTGGRATGRLVFNGRKAPPTDLRSAGINFQNAPGSSECQPMFGMGGPNRPTVNADGTFVAENLWGACVLRAGGAVGGWQLEAVTHRGNDVTTRPIQFQTGQTVTDLQLVFTDRVGDLSLEVADERGLPLTEYVAVVFPVEKERWGDQRFVRTHVASAALTPVQMGGQQFEVMRTMNGGMFVQGSSSVSASSVSPGSAPDGTQAGGTRPPIIRSLIAGEYYAVVLDDLSYDELRDPEFLAQLANVATRVSVAEGDARPLQLRRVPVPENK